MGSRKLNLALTLGIVVELLEILRRTPRWLFAVVALATYTLIYAAATHLVLAACSVAVLIVVRQGLGPQDSEA